MGTKGNFIVQRRSKSIRRWCSGDGIAWNIPSKRKKISRASILGLTL